jgi:hypothetical protein
MMLGAAWAGLSALRTDQLPLRQGSDKPLLSNAAPVLRVKDIAHYLELSQSTVYRPLRMEGYSV